jgi:hypothetical protein
MTIEQDFEKVRDGLLSQYSAESGRAALSRIEAEYDVLKAALEAHKCVIHKRDDDGPYAVVGDGSDIRQALDQLEGKEG